MHSKYQAAIKLRKKGKSYREIAKALDISKNSVSRWCKNLKLPRTAQKIIAERVKHIQDKFRVYNQRKHRIVQAENKKIREKAANQIHSLSKYDLLLIGAALYWGEGQKRFSSSGYPRIHFANSDPYIITLFFRFLREIIKASEEELKVSIRVHPNINEKEAVKFWSEITKIPKERFRITHQISRFSRGKRPKKSLPYGTLHLYVNKRRKFYQIKGWIDGLIRQI